MVVHRSSASNLSEFVNSSTFQIRDYAASDLEQVAEVYNLSRAPLDCFSTDEVTAAQFAPLIRGEDLQVAMSGEFILGFVAVWRPETFIHHLYILPAHQREGIARALIQSCVQRYGYPLSLKSLRANAQACAFYEKNDWMALETGTGPDGPYNYYWLRDV